MLREHFSTSLADLLRRVTARVDQLPPWLRPAFFGAGFVFALMLWRGGLIVLPIAFVYLLVKNPPILLKLLPLIFIYVPGAGFLGGLLYGITERALRPLGKTGRILQFILGTWIYCALLIFFIMPLLAPFDARASTPISTPAKWIISGCLGVFFGLTLGINATSDTRDG